MSRPKCPKDLFEFTHDIQGVSLTVRFSYEGGEPATWDDPGCDAEVTIEAVYAGDQDVYAVLADCVNEALYDAALAWINSECDSALEDKAAARYEEVAA